MDGNGSNKQLRGIDIRPVDIPRHQERVHLQASRAVKKLLPLATLNLRGSDFT